MVKKQKRRKIIWLLLATALSAVSFALFPYALHWTIGRMLIGHWSTMPGQSLVLHQDGREELLDRKGSVEAFGHYKLIGNFHLVIDHQYFYYRGIKYDYSGFGSTGPTDDITDYDIRMERYGRIIRAKLFVNPSPHPLLWGKEEIWEKQ